MDEIIKKAKLTKRNIGIEIAIEYAWAPFWIGGAKTEEVIFEKIATNVIRPVQESLKEDFK